MVNLTCATCGATCQATNAEGQILTAYFYDDGEAQDRTGVWSLIQYDNGWFDWAGKSSPWCPACAQHAVINLNHLF